MPAQVEHLLSVPFLIWLFKFLVRFFYDDQFVKLKILRVRLIISKLSLGPGPLPTVVMHFFLTNIWFGNKLERLSLEAIPLF